MEHNESVKQSTKAMIQDMEAKAKLIVEGDKEALIRLIAYTIHQFGKADTAGDLMGKVCKGCHDMRKDLLPTYTGPERRKTIRSLTDVDCRVPR